MPSSHGGGAFEYNDGMRSDARTMIGFSLDDIVEGIPAALLVFQGRCI
jgi:hypothetical protein